ncbi:serine/threonine-protein kinase Chk1 [Nematocida displodere]|uniref:Serine/threonine-protein kinase Chk1 n=1 Tax=Nematocida displodere TaxID=1805483 RepID=A0A177EDG2_9MICR|nr:serine/threonine-protein kinase Chk1 [Nematocida displodere]
MTMAMTEEAEWSKHGVPNLVLENVVAYGGSGVVRKARSSSGSEYAVKIILADDPARHQAAKKESAIHKALAHRHIVKLHSVYVNRPYVYLVMDYAVGHELFHYIEPGSGMAEDVCHLYLKQLHSALRYIHSQGLCHRDIKPENILLDENYNLLLADFGCSTIYRDAYGRRPLTKHCGSPNYMAPDVFLESYDGEQVDVWSFGMVALVMLTGVIPWAEPCAGDASFEKYKLKKTRDFTPFNLLAQSRQVFIESMLCIDASKRIRLSEIGLNPWMASKSLYSGPDGLVRQPEMIAAKLAPAVDPAFSQPDFCISPAGKEYSSQPVFMSYDKSPIATRLYTHMDTKVSLGMLARSFDEVLIQHKVSGTAMSFSTVDGNKNPIGGEVFCKSIGKESMLVFQRTRGNCLEFKRMFNAVKEKFMEHSEAYLIRRNKY